MRKIKTFISTNFFSWTLLGLSMLFLYNCDGRIENIQTPATKTTPLPRLVMPILPYKVDSAKTHPAIDTIIQQVASDSLSKNDTLNNTSQETKQELNRKINPRYFRRALNIHRRTYISMLRMALREGELS